ncbi:MAG: hypothetical protein ACI83B_003315 [Sediminicola sp.]
MKLFGFNPPENKIFYENDVIQFDNSPFLFLKQHDVAQHQYQYFLGERTLTEQKYELFERNAAFNVDYCMKKEITYQHIVFPAKIPVFSSLFRQAGIDVKSLFCKRHKHNNVHYPYSTLDMDHDYMVQDTHNSDIGKIKLVKFMMSQLNVDYIEHTPIWKDAEVVGDMGKRLGRSGYREKKLVGFEGLKTKPKLFSTTSALSGNSGQIFFSINPNAAKNSRILLFGDSFIHTCINIFAHQFTEVIYIRSPFVIPDIADNLEPDYIITSNAERYLTSIQDAEAKKPYFLNYFSSAFNPSNFSLANKNALFALFSGRRSHTYNVWKRKVVKELM